MELIDERGVRHPQSGQTALLVALLATSWPRPVHVGRIEDAFWQDAVPRSANIGIRVVVAKVRATLRRASDDPVPFVDGAYRLALGADELDLVRFEAAAAAAAPALLDGRADDALAHVTSARALWRGEPFGAAVATAALTGEAVRLDELRMRLDETEVDARLVLGDPESSALRARTLVAEAPLRERRWEQLVLALYRCGRQAEALRAYADAVETLRETLGLDPNVRLRSLERSILTQDPSLRGPAVAAPVALGTAPAPPAAPAMFVGRDALLGAVLGRLRSGGHVSLVGPAGVGKTRLATELSAASERAAVFVTLGDGLPCALVETVATALSINAHASGDPLRLVTDCLRRSSCLIVLDDCDRHARDVADLVQRLVAACADVAVLTTSRQAIGNESEQRVRVDPLDDPDAQALLRLRAPELAGVNHPGAVAAIVDAVDRLPLAIELAAAQTDAIGIDELERRLRESIELLNMPRRSVVRHRTMVEAIHWSMELVSPLARHVLCGLGAMRGRFDAIAAAQVAGVDDRHAVQALRELARASLIDVDEGVPTTHYKLLETVRLYAQQHQGDAATRFQEAHAEHYTRFVAERTPQLFGVQETAATTTVAAAWDQVREAFRWARDHGRADLMRTLAVHMAPMAWIRLEFDVRSWPASVVRNEESQGPAVDGDLLAWAGVDAWTNSQAPAARTYSESTLAITAADSLSHLVALQTLVAVDGVEGRQLEAGERLLAAIRSAQLLGDDYWRTNVQGIATLGATVSGLEEVAHACAGAARKHADRCGAPSASAWASFASGLALQNDRPDDAA
ncbi:MAG: BTAD domain-containing putative transcriptional regulator, partial [Ilumatobacteraceae bacterium]